MQNKTFNETDENFGIENVKISSAEQTLCKTVKTWRMMKIRANCAPFIFVK
jgi:hypothetical protein